MGFPRAYRLVGGPRHGEVVITEAAVVYDMMTEGDFQEALALYPAPFADRMKVGYRVASFGGKRPEAASMRLDVMLSSDLHVALSADERSAEVAWALLDAFMEDIPYARSSEEKSDARRARRCVYEARAALQRARRHLPKDPRMALGGTISAACWALEQGIRRCDDAGDWLEGRNPLGKVIVIPAEEVPHG